MEGNIRNYTTAERKRNQNTTAIGNCISLTKSSAQTDLLLRGEQVGAVPPIYV